jgi:hypothetical protein
MAQQQNNPIEQVLELLTEQGSDALAEALRTLLNAAMLFERERFLTPPHTSALPSGATMPMASNPNACAHELAYLTLAYLGCAVRTSTHRRLSEVRVLSER